MVGVCVCVFVCVCQCACVIASRVGQMSEEKERVE